MSSDREGRISIGKMQGHSLDFGRWVDHQQKRHYWGLPKKNLGFYTTQQLLEVQRRHKVLKTEGNQSYKGEPRFIVDRANFDFVHCCTCHNNPKRYLNEAEACAFCQEFRKQSAYKSLPKLKQSINPQEDGTPQSGLKRFQEKSIQVSLKLPLIRKHNSKYPSNCTACKEKDSEIQVAKVQKRVMTQSPRVGEGESMLYSFSSKKKGKQLKF